MERIVIDTREDFEYKHGHVEGSLNIPPEQFMNDTIPQQLSDALKDSPIIVYCRSGSRANVVARILERHGFTNVTNGINQDHTEKLIAK